MTLPRLIIHLLLAVTALGPQLCHGMSGNAQVSLAGQGKFDELAAGVEAMVGREPMKAADWHALCYAYSRVKSYSKIMGCLDQLERAMAGPDKRTRLFGLTDGTAVAYLLRAETLIELGDYPNALMQADRALLWYEREKDDAKDLLIGALAAKSLASLGMGHREAAERFAAELENLRLGFLDSEVVGTKALAMARVNLALHRWQKVIDALASDKTFGLRSFLDNLASGAFLAGVNNWVWIELPRGFMLTKAMLELGRLNEAKVAYDKLLAVREAAANGGIYWLALHDRGRIAESENQLESAEQYYLRAVEIVERQRISINSEANKIGFVGDKQALYTDLIAVQFRLEKFSQAFESMERGKSRALVDLLASRPARALVSPDSAALKRTLELIEKMDQADLDALRQNEARILAGHPAVEVAGGGVIASALPAGIASLLRVSSLDVKEAQSLIAKDEALLVYFGSGKHLFATLVQSNGVWGVAIDASNLDADLQSLRLGIKQGLPSVPGQLQAMHKRLIAPLAAHMTASRLSIAPHGGLHYLPFAALNDGRQDLIDRYTLRVLPNVSVLKYLRPTHGKGIERMLVFGNPDLNNASMDLPGAQAEAEHLASQFKAQHLMLRKAATRSAFRELAPHALFIHVASHGEFDAAKPLNSGLMLAADSAGAKADDGRLTVSDIYQLRLDAELVTLSACETGLGSVANGDDIVGLTRGFLYAGASTVVASLWQVDDEATSFLMERMYGYLQKEGRHDALRKAQMDTRAKFRNPLYWAAFYSAGLN